MKRLPHLFVDIDDTLVTWKKDGVALEGMNPLGGGATEWEPNCDVVHLIRAWVAEGYKVVIWSGGGHQYALDWARTILPNIDANVYSKFDMIPDDGDVFIDDLDGEANSYAWKHRVIHPRDLKGG